MLRNHWNLGGSHENASKRVERSQPGFPPLPLATALVRLAERIFQRPTPLFQRNPKRFLAGSIKGTGFELDSFRLDLTPCLIRLPFSLYTMPAQSRLLPFDGYNGLDMVPFISEHHPITIPYLLEHSPLTMSLRDRHLHCASAAGNLFSIDFQLATSIWFILKDISHTIQLTANPLLNPFGDLSSMIDPELLEQINMPFPTVLSIENYTQNLLIIMSSRAKLV